MNNKNLEQGKRILELRTRKGLTQEEVSKLTNISVPYISRIEQGKVNITMKTLIEMSNALDCSLQYLEEGYQQNKLCEVVYSSDNESSNTYPKYSEQAKRIRKSEHSLKDKDFAKYRRDIRDSIDDILYNCDYEMIRTLKLVIEKISDYSFTRNSMNQMDPESVVHYHERCLKYINDISDELEYQIEHFLPEE